MGTLFFIQVRMQSGTSGTVIVTQSCLKSFRQIYSEEGLRGLYRVSIPTNTTGVYLGDSRSLQILVYSRFPNILLTSADLKIRL
jgi:hydrogenase maturation factor HypF (carbamoyltransferase family)